VAASYVRILRKMRKIPKIFGAGVREPRLARSRAFAGGRVGGGTSHHAKRARGDAEAQARGGNLTNLT